MSLLRQSSSPVRSGAATRQAGAVVLVAGATLGATLGAISVLMRNHKHGLSAEPDGSAGPKRP